MLLLDLLLSFFDLSNMPFISLSLSLSLGREEPVFTRMFVLAGWIGDRRRRRQSLNRYISVQVPARMARHTLRVARRRHVRRPTVSQRRCLRCHDDGRQQQRQRDELPLFVSNRFRRDQL